MSTSPDEKRLPSGRHGLTRETVLSSQRGRMLHAMARAVAERGLAQATVADVLRDAKVSRETFYQHFSNKLECFLAAYETGAETALGAMVSAAQGAEASGASGREQFVAAVGAYLDAIEEEPLLARTFLIEILAAGPEQIRLRAQVHQSFVTAVHGMLDEPDHPVDRFTAAMIVGGVSQMVTMRVAAGEHEGLPELHPAIVRHVDRVLAGVDGDRD